MVFLFNDSRGGHLQQSQEELIAAGIERQKRRIWDYCNKESVLNVHDVRSRKISCNSWCSL